jgi:hypothetical protein
VAGPRHNRARPRLTAVVVVAPSPRPGRSPRARAPFLRVARLARGRLDSRGRLVPRAAHRHRHPSRRQGQASLARVQVARVRQQGDLAWAARRIPGPSRNPAGWPRISLPVPAGVRDRIDPPPSPHGRDRIGPPHCPLDQDRIDPPRARRVRESDQGGLPPSPLDRDRIGPPRARRVRESDRGGLPHSPLDRDRIDPPRARRVRESDRIGPTVPTSPSIRVDSDRIARTTWSTVRRTLLPAGRRT